MHRSAAAATVAALLLVAPRVGAQPMNGQPAVALVIHGVDPIPAARQLQQQGISPLSIRYENRGREDIAATVRCRVGDRTLSFTRNVGHWGGQFEYLFWPEARAATELPHGRQHVACEIVPSRPAGGATPAALTAHFETDVDLPTAMLPDLALTDPWLRTPVDCETGAPAVAGRAVCATIRVDQLARTDWSEPDAVIDCTVDGRSAARPERFRREVTVRIEPVARGRHELRCAVGLAVPNVRDANAANDAAVGSFTVRDGPATWDYDVAIERIARGVMPTQIPCVQCDMPTTMRVSGLVLSIASRGRDVPEGVTARCRIGAIELDGTASPRDRTMLVTTRSPLPNGPQPVTCDLTITTPHDVPDRTPSDNHATATVDVRSP